jgi:hypothetical protein
MPEWTPKQTETLLFMRSQGATLSAIGDAVGRKRSAIAGRIYRMGLPLICPQNAHPGARGRYTDRR